MDNQAMKNLGFKIGVSSAKILRRAQELNRLIQLRCSSLALNDSCRAVMCFELAATEHKHPINKESAVQLSGVNKKVYANSFKTLQTLLGLNPTVTIRDLAVQFGCVGVIEHANQVLQSYHKEFEDKVSEAARDDVDFSKPLFTGAALYTICKRQKIKVDKTKLVEMTGARRGTFDKLCAEMEKHATQLFGEKKSKQSKRHHSWMDDLEKSFEDGASLPKQSKGDQDSSSSKQDDYEEWKRRILEGVPDTNK
ncbi:origin recognition complex subunit 6-like [Lytechinus variegatus]|uniref:origin recognition complex subunit 6-like n=1 Tax=Lytechinus variegatus TaxID=7654 RepID=UPI001BB22B55|nr:origin recognition complex subunit 6-like [Lytechinus variegatus]